IGARIQGARDRLVAEVAALPQQPQAEFSAAAASAPVEGAAATGDYAAAATALGERFAGAEVAEIHPPTLEDAYGDLRSFGFAKLALLNDVLKQGTVQMAFSRAGNAITMDFAAPVRDRGVLVGIAYARRPLPDLDGQVGAL